MTFLDVVFAALFLLGLALAGLVYWLVLALDRVRDDPIWRALGREDEK
jgi:hypothetical protein